MSKTKWIKKNYDESKEIRNRDYNQYVVRVAGSSFYDDSFDNMDDDQLIDPYTEYPQG